MPGNPSQNQSERNRIHKSYLAAQEKGLTSDLKSWIAASSPDESGKELIESHLGVLFSGPDAEEAREWLLSVEDEKLRESLSLQAGLAFNLLVVAGGAIA